MQQLNVRPESLSTALIMCRAVRMTLASAYVSASAIFLNLHSSSSGYKYLYFALFLLSSYFAPFYSTYPYIILISENFFFHFLSVFTAFIILQFPYFSYYCFTIFLPFHNNIFLNCYYLSFLFPSSSTPIFVPSSCENLCRSNTY